MGSFSFLLEEEEGWIIYETTRADSVYSKLCSGIRDICSKLKSSLIFFKSIPWRYFWSSPSLATITSLLRLNFFSSSFNFYSFLLNFFFLVKSYGLFTRWYFFIISFLFNLLYLWNIIVSSSEYNLGFYWDRNLPTSFLYMIFFYCYKKNTILPILRPRTEVLRSWSSFVWINFSSLLILFLFSPILTNLAL